MPSSLCRVGRAGNGKSSEEDRGCVAGKRRVDQAMNPRSTSAGPRTTGPIFSACRHTRWQNPGPAYQLCHHCRRPLHLRPSAAPLPNVDGVRLELRSLAVNMWTVDMVSSCVGQYYSSTLEYQKLFWVVSNLYIYHTYHVRENDTSRKKQHVFSPQIMRVLL